MKLILPFSVTIPRKTKEAKVWILNLNNYRNTHFHILNQAKVEWGKIVAKAVDDIQIVSPWMERARDKYGYGYMSPPVPPYKFIYTVYPKDNRSFDLSNVLSVVEKFTNDALIDCGVIKNDNCKIIPQVDYRFGGVSKTNPRIELEVISIDTTFETAEEAGL